MNMYLTNMIESLKFRLGFRTLARRSHHPHQYPYHRTIEPIKSLSIEEKILAKHFSTQEQFSTND